MDSAKSCAFTGHRPEKLPWGTREEDLRCLALKARLLREIDQAYLLGCRHFLTGMARGTDTYFGEAVVHYRNTHPDVTLEAAIPYIGQSQRWTRAEQIRYQSLVAKCDFETVIQHHYDRGCMQRRNRYLVDHAVRLIAVYDGMGKSGTLYTLTYALKQGRDVVIIDC